VAHIQEDLSQRIRVLEQELRSALDEKERAFRYHRVEGQPRFEAATLAQHRKLRFGLPSYILHSRTLVILTAPIISYANGLCACFTEVAARTEQHWCPIKHARRLRAPHSRYPRFLDFGDASRYRRQIETARNDFVDLRNLKAPRLDSSAK